MARPSRHMVAVNSLTYFFKPLFSSKRVWYAPDISINLISIDCLNQDGYNVNFMSWGGCLISLNGRLAATGSREGKLRKFNLATHSLSEHANAASNIDKAAANPDITSEQAVSGIKETLPPNDEIPPTENQSKPANGSLEHWHKRLGHLNVDSVKRVLKRHNITWTNEKDFDRKTCLPCLQGKQHVTRRKSQKGTTKPLELIHSDISGILPS